MEVSPTVMACPSVDAAACIGRKIYDYKIFAILNVRGSADTEKIKEAYKKVICLNHPDVGGKTSRGFVQLWQGDQDLLVSVTLQRYIAEKLPWIQYHELTEAGHMFPYDDGIGEKFFRALLLGMQ
ncbi:hypothetical protein IFM89_023556 [Coptis chinensis]|uniref:J domain-containing protein n=1 Tax=Coptis chinensis TaxID=261450 RepID=A0A835ICF8_9MAGN|nr:hypothetical protein IFM89_023556 [Coptis chinensis]